MHSFEHLQREYDRLVAQGTRLAGGLTDLAQRAAVYHHVFEDSGRNHIFPLIAAHGALWARGYFGFGMRLGRHLAWQFPFSSERRQRAVLDLAAFADAFREINRQVCVDTYASYHFTERFGNEPGAERLISPDLLESLNRVHAAKRAGLALTDRDKRDVFESHFRNEQAHVVGPRIARAIEEFQWPLLKSIALRPLVRFAYFRPREYFWFRHFDRVDERIERGLRAFDIAAEVGWKRVESSLKEYDVLPAAFFANSTGHFATICNTVLAQA